jgi:hypothetical protein
MPRQIVAGSKITSYQFATCDTAAVAAAVERFRELTGKGLMAAAKESDGHIRIVRSFDFAADETLFFDLQAPWNAGPLDLLRTISFGAYLENFWHSYRRPTDILEVVADEILRNWLSLEQRTEFEASRRFHAIGRVTGKRYCITMSYPPELFEVDEHGTILNRLHCVSSLTSTPAMIMLIQKIVLETDEGLTFRRSPLDSEALAGFVPTLFPPG